MKWKNINQYFLKLFTFALLILVSLSSYAQDEICDEPVSGNVKKLYEKGKNYKKYNYKQRVKFFKDALEIEEECIPCMWELAKMSFRRRYSLGEPMDFPKKYFLQLSQLCPHYHADVFYYLSLIFYMEKNDCEAKNYFTQFLDFPTDDKKKIAINYTDQKSYVKASLEMSSYFCDFYTNPVPFNPRLISSVSTPDKNEVLPVISPDNEQLYFTCEYDEHIKGDVMVNHAQVFKMSTRENMKSNFTTPFSLIDLYGISSHEKDYRICWAINNSLGLSLERTTENIEVIFNQQEKQNSQFPIFKFERDDMLETYYLIGNKHENQQLIEEQKHVDFFLMVKSSDAMSSHNIIDNLRDIPFVLSVNKVDVTMLRSKKNLIF